MGLCLNPAPGADLESVKIPGVKETAEEVAQGDQQEPSMQDGTETVPTRTEEGLVEGAVAPLPSSAAPPGTPARAYEVGQPIRGVMPQDSGKARSP